MKLRTMAPALALAAGLLGRSPAAAQESYRVSGREVAVYNLAGHVRMVAGSGSDVQVVVSTGGKDAGRLKVVTGEVDGRPSLRVVYPEDRVVYPALGRGSRTQVSVDEDGVFGVHGRSRGDRVTVAGSGGGMEAWADLEVQVPRGKDVTLHLAAGDTEVEGVEATVRVDAGSGSVSARRVRGALSLDTGSGSVTVSDVEGAVEVDTGSGGVKGAGIRGASLKVGTGSGSIELTGVAASEVLLDTGSGSVELELLEDVDRLDVDTGSGSVTIRVPESLGAEVELDTGSGGIDLGVPVEVRSVKRDYLLGRLGDGKGHIHVETGSGGVRLARSGS